jgi:hypothetical protein
MPDSSKKSNVKPLEPKDIKRVLFERDVTIAALARRATEELDREVTAWQMRAVIHRFPGVVYQEIREWLAGWLGCEVWQVGNEPVRESQQNESEAAA